MNYYYRSNGEVEELGSRLIRKLQESEGTARRLSKVLILRDDIKERVNQLSLLRDASQIGTSTVIFVTEASRFAKPNALLCADIFEAAGYECLRFSDRESQECGNLLLETARLCREFAIERYQYW